MSDRKPIPKSVRFRVLQRDGFRCRYCGATPPDVVLHLDHVLAVARGGGNEEDNLITACLPCNIGKGVLPASPPTGLPSEYATRTPLDAPRVEFLWCQDLRTPTQPILDARCLRVPDRDRDVAPLDWQEMDRYLRSKHGNFYATHGYSTDGFSPYEAAMYATEILGNRWDTLRSYLTFIDDLIEHASQGRLPQYLAPAVLRATHPDVVNMRCGSQDPSLERVCRSIADQAIAAFRPFLDQEHSAYSEGGRLGVGVSGHQPSYPRRGHA